jgi:hypothetical protein
MTKSTWFVTPKRKRLREQWRKASKKYYQKNHEININLLEKFTEGILNYILSEHSKEPQK